MTETIYIETSILGHLTARPSQNVILIANMEITRQWWEDYRQKFNLYISQIVLDEIAQGDQEIAKKRLELVKDFTLLKTYQSARSLALEFINKSNLPTKAANDALHIAIATIYELDYLIAWNCKHIANAQIQKKLSQISRGFGYQLPTLCTPYELIST
jgi:hypothetical protein